MEAEGAHAREGYVRAGAYGGGTPAGILLADLTGLVVQWCLFKANGIPLANGGGAVGNATASRCPF